MTSLHVTMTSCLEQAEGMQYPYRRGAVVATPPVTRLMTRNGRNGTMPKPSVSGASSRLD